MMNSVTWKIGGEAGFGIISSGTMLARTFSRSGYYVFATNEYPSLIRGGHNLVTVRIATEKFASLNRDLHILVALNQETIELHKQETNTNTIIIFDPKDGQPKLTSAKFLPIPLSELVSSHQGDPIMRNTVALGATIAVLGFDFAKLQAVITDQFKRKSKEVIEHNLTIAREGYDFVKKNFSDQSLYLDPPAKTEKQLIVNGSEAVGIGAVRAGLKFAAIYPMTPINALITFLADHAKELGIVYKQPEDEIAGINMALGASLAGVRSMVATSGGGFALMVEGLSWAGMIEAPLVIDLGMRVGPSTGMPTWSEQGELQFVVHAGHGEFARIVLAPADATEAYALTIKAFNLADKYQIPVFVLTDKYLNESQWCVLEKDFAGEVEINRGKFITKIDSDYKRYDLNTEDGVSPRVSLGTPNGFYIANSYEHDEFGFVTENSDARTAMAQKRLKKLASITKEIMPPQIYGESGAETVLVSWGSTKGAILEALKLIPEQKIKLLHYSWLFPFPAEFTEKELKTAKKIISVEQNATGQLAALITEYTGIKISDKILKYDGRPFYPEEILEKL